MTETSLNCKLTKKKKNIKIGIGCTGMIDHSDISIMIVALNEIENFIFVIRSVISIKTSCPFFIFVPLTNIKV